ncbi:MAG TPA: T9SS type A sorting domain-containing protein [Chitinophagaceae bacterium]|nr:T9SS type A sorting domain-containing protein [Chitinophagaceae bacterium]
MKKLVLLTLLGLIVIVRAKSQVLFNEVYTDPGAGKHEFFEFYSTSTSTLPQSLNNYTIVTFYERPGEKGFFVMDLPNISINPRGFAVGSSAYPFNYQGVAGSSASNFSWNDPALASNEGYVKKWILKSNNLVDGNLSYDEEILPNPFNDFFFRRTGVGASYSVFLFKDGQLINTVIFGTGGYNAVIPVIITMPKLTIDMMGSAPDFAIDFSTFNSIPIEYVGQDAGSDNGYIRENDGQCGSWDKSSAQVQHTPLVSNGYVDDTQGDISVSTVINRGTAATGSTIIYDVVAAPLTSFPVTLQVYFDNGSNAFQLDGTDNFFESNIEYQVSDGAFWNTFFPHNANMLVVAISSVGCIDKVMSIPNVATLPVGLSNFQGNRNREKVRLDWTVATNELIERFEVERSSDGQHFSSQAQVLASEKTGSDLYEFFESAQNTGKLYYRLKVYSKDQKFTYSKTLVFQDQATADNNLLIINNPVTDKLTVSFANTGNQTATLRIFDLAGRVMMTQKMATYEGTNTLSLPLSSGMNAGIYIAEVNTGPDRYISKFVKQ